MTRNLFAAAFAVALAAPSLALADAAPAAPAGSAWEVDSSHSAAQFSVKHLMVSTVRGQLGKVTGTINYDPKNLAKSTVEASIDVSGINTREDKRDAHLKSPDFFDVAKFPAVTFKSTKVEKAGKHLKITGDLTIHGVTKPVVLDTEVSPEMKDPWGNTKIGATATGKINRKDYGLTWNKALEAGGVVVGDEVQLIIDVELNKKK